MLDHRRKAVSKMAAACATLAWTFGCACIVASGCSSSDAPVPAEAAACPPGGGPMPGMAADTCMGMFQAVGMCMTEAPDSGATDQDAGPEMFPPAHVGTSSTDDDCKYSVSFTNDCVQKGGTGTTFRVTLKSLTQNMALVSGANPYIEAYLNENHPAGGNPMTTVVSPGVYDIGPIVFDVGGTWTVRFHFFGDCSDVPDDSPHAHAAFLITVPD